MNSDVPISARALTELAGVRLPADRELALTAGLEASTRPIAEALARRDYGDAAPAPRFRPPPCELR